MRACVRACVRAGKCSRRWRRRRAGALPLAHLSCSPCGRFLAASDFFGDLNVWLIGAAGGGDAAVTTTAAAAAAAAAAAGTPLSQRVLQRGRVIDHFWTRESQLGLLRLRPASSRAAVPPPLAATPAAAAAATASTTAASNPCAVMDFVNVPSLTSGPELELSTRWSEAEAEEVDSAVPSSSSPETACFVTFVAPQGTVEGSDDGGGSVDDSGGRVAAAGSAIAVPREVFEFELATATATLQVATGAGGLLVLLKTTSAMDGETVAVVHTQVAQPIDVAGLLQLSARRRNFDLALRLLQEWVRCRCVALCCIDPSWWCCAVHVRTHRPCVPVCKPKHTKLTALALSVRVCGRFNLRRDTVVKYIVASFVDEMVSVEEQFAALSRDSSAVAPTTGEVGSLVGRRNGNTAARIIVLGQGFDAGVLPHPRD